MATKEDKEAEKAKKEAEKLAKERAKKEAEEAKQAKKEAERLAKEKAREKADEAKGKARPAKKESAAEADSATYQGNFQLVLPVSVGFKQVQQFADSMAGIEGLKIVWTGGSVDEGAIIAVSLSEAVPLVGIISKMPIVEKVEVKGEKVSITLKMGA